VSTLVRPQASQPVPVLAPRDPAENTVIRKFSLALALILVFLRMSNFHQVEAFLLHVNLKILYVFGIPAVMGAVLCGGLQRTFRGTPAYFWTGYWLWMTVAIPFSSWPGDSARVSSIYLRTNLIMLFIVGGLVIGWKECQTLMRSFVWGAIGTLMVAKLFQGGSGNEERFALEFGSISNSNDFACHLLLCLPFLYWVVLSSKSIVARILCMGGIAYGVLLVIQTASRGALISLAVVALCVLLWGSTVQRLALIVLVPVAFAGITAVVSKETLSRIISFSASDTTASAEALESSRTRKYLLEKSIEYTLTHPLFGVGLGQFANYEGTHNQVIGTHGSWHSTHNSFTQAASECGIPGVLFFAGGLLATFKIFYSAFRKARNRPDCQDIKNAMFCLMLAMVGFVVSFSFLNFAYLFYQPLLGGVAIVMASATKEEFAKRDLAAAQSLVSQSIV